MRHFKERLKFKPRCSTAILTCCTKCLVGRREMVLAVPLAGCPGWSLLPWTRAPLLPIVCPAAARNDTTSGNPSFLPELHVCEDGWSVHMWNSTVTRAGGSSWGFETLLRGNWPGTSFNAVSKCATQRATTLKGFKKTVGWTMSKICLEMVSFHFTEVKWNSAQ